MRKAITSLVGLARKNNIALRQSYERVVKRAAIKSGRYRHAKQMRRAKREEQFIRIRLGRVIRDISRKIQGNNALKAIFTSDLLKAFTVQTSSATAQKKSIHGMRWKRNALVKAKRISPTSLVARCR